MITLKVESALELVTLSLEVSMSRITVRYCAY